jgi:uncharacterized protein with beta-barrel porin domain
VTQAEVVAHARAAWGRYMDTGGAVTVRFVDLPDSAFSITGVRPDRDAALVTAGFEVRLTPQLSIGAQLDGEFSRHVSEYGGSARLRLAF